MRTCGAHSLDGPQGSSEFISECSGDREEKVEMSYRGQARGEQPRASRVNLTSEQRFSLTQSVAVFDKAGQWGCRLPSLKPHPAPPCQHLFQIQKLLGPVRGPEMGMALPGPWGESVQQGAEACLPSPTWLPAPFPYQSGGRDPAWERARGRQ